MDEITAEFEAVALVSPVELKTRLSTTVACKTDLGRVRENNEDKFEYYLTENEAELASRGLIFLVCDGMGGHAAGQIASELSAKTYIEVYRNHPSPDPEVAATAAVIAANRFVLDVSRAIPSRRGMGTTLSGLMLIQGRGLVVQVGDSRVYRCRNGGLEQLTIDHTWCEEMVRAGMLSPEEAASHPNRHVITRAIGTEANVQPDLFWVDLEVNDIFLLCSDGLMEHVSDAEIQNVLASSGPSQAAWQLVNMAVAGGGRDNTTVVIVRLDDLKTSNSAD